MSRVFSYLALFLLLAGIFQCSKDHPTAPPAERVVNLGDPIALRVGDSLRISETGLRLKFDKVTFDNRCGSSAACDWGGVGEVSLIASKGTQSAKIDLAVEGEPKLIGSAITTALVERHEIRLVSLDRLGLSGAGPAQYEATIDISLGASAATLPAIVIADEPVASAFEPAEFKHAEVSDDTLKIRVVDAASCAPQYYWLTMAPAGFTAGERRAANLYLYHFSRTVTCGTRAERTIQFSLRAVQDLHRNLFGEDVAIDLTIHVVGREPERDTTVIFANTPSAPVIEPITSFSVAEGDTLIREIRATDRNGDPITLTAENLPTHCRLTDMGDGTGRLEFAPDYQQSGRYDVAVVAFDGWRSSREEFAINVRNVNRRPSLWASIPSRSPMGVTQSTFVYASDPDGIVPMIAAVQLPRNCTLHDSGIGIARLTITPDASQFGNQKAWIYAWDGTDTASAEFVFHVDSINYPPEIDLPADVKVYAGREVEFEIKAVDADGTVPKIAPLVFYPGAVFKELGPGRASYRYRADPTISGTVVARFAAIDERYTVEGKTDMIVLSLASGVRIEEVGDQTVLEGDTLVVELRAHSDYQTPYFQVVGTSSSVPERGFKLKRPADTWTLTYFPSYTAAGDHWFKLRASDGVTADTVTIQVRVLEAGNQPPTWEPIGTIYTWPGKRVEFRVTAGDPDAVPPLVGAIRMPIGATINSDRPGSGLVAWTPGDGDVGVNDFQFEAVDAVDPTIRISLTAQVRVFELTENTGQIFPAAIGNYWIYETQSTWFRSGIDSVWIADTTRVGDRLYWILAGRHYPVPQRYYYQGDSVHVEAVDFPAVLYYPTWIFADPRIGRAAAGPTGAYSNTYEWCQSDRGYPVSSSVCVQFAPGVGPLYFYSGSGCVSLLNNCGGNAGGRHIQSLIRYHVKGASSQ